MRPGAADSLCAVNTVHLLGMQCVGCTWCCPHVHTCVPRALSASSKFVLLSLDTRGELHWYTHHAVCRHHLGHTPGLVHTGGTDGVHCGLLVTPRHDWVSGDTDVLLDVRRKPPSSRLSLGAELYVGPLSGWRPLCALGLFPSGNDEPSHRMATAPD